MVLPDTAFQRGAQVIRIRTKEAGRPGEQSLGVRLAPDQPTEERSAAGTEQVADEPRDLDVGVFQGLLQARRVLGHLADELFARAGTVQRTTYSSPPCCSASASGTTEPATETGGLTGR